MLLGAAPADGPLLLADGFLPGQCTGAKLLPPATKGFISQSTDEESISHFFTLESADSISRQVMDIGDDL